MRNSSCSTMFSTTFHFITFRDSACKSLWLNDMGQFQQLPGCSRCSPPSQGRVSRDLVGSYYGCMTSGTGSLQQELTATPYMFQMFSTFSRESVTRFGRELLWLYDEWQFVVGVDGNSLDVPDIFHLLKGQCQKIWQGVTLGV